MMDAYVVAIVLLAVAVLYGVPYLVDRGSARRDPNDDDKPGGGKTMGDW